MWSVLTCSPVPENKQTHSAKAFKKRDNNCSHCESSCRRTKTSRINTFLSLLLKERLPQRENLEVSPYVSSLPFPYCLHVWIHARFRVFVVMTCVLRKQLLDVSQKIRVRGLVLFTESMIQSKLQNLSIFSSGLDQMIFKKPSRTKVCTAKLFWQ